MDLGIRPENTLVMAVDPKTAGYSDERFRELLRLVDTRIGSLPGVRSAAASNILPLSLAHNGDSFFEPSAGKDKGAGADILSVTAPYFETIGLPLLRGRNFRPDSDVKNGVMIVNQTMARRIFGDRDPIGRTLKSGGGDTYEVIGVAKDSKSVTLGEEVKACGYAYLPRNPSRDVISLLGMTILVKTEGDPSAMMNTLRREVERLDPNLAVFNVQTMQEHVNNAFLVPRLCATLFGTFGLLGLVLAGVGLYGVASYSVRSRTREIGIRMALGARPNSILRLVTGQGLGIVAAGLALGLGAAWGLSRFIASLLYGVSSTDAITFLAVPAALLATALAALLVPARRASGLDPMKALRTE
jgi:predicted permease